VLQDHFKYTTIYGNDQIHYPITFSDFLLADVTDSVLDGVIASFPATFAAKVGKTSGEKNRAHDFSLS
jgi:hypothetical protein